MIQAALVRALDLLLQFVAWFIGSVVILGYLLVSAIGRIGQRRRSIR